jgi:hypothetical protein
VKKKEKRMNFKNFIVRTLLVLGMVCACWPLILRTRAAEAAPPLPPIIEAGFAVWTKGAAMDGVFNVWQKGGVLEGDSKGAGQANYLRTVIQLAGNYVSHDVLQTKLIGRSSKVIYMEIEFDRAAVYARFLVYRTEKGWVVQSMDFSTRPEALMPWLAIEGDRNAS